MGELSFKNNTYWLRADTEEENALAIEHGFLYDSVTLKWFTRKPQKAVHFRWLADKSAEKIINQIYITDHLPPEFIPYPNDLEPKVFQLESAWHCLTRSPAYCADEAGLGKTITATLCMNAKPGKVVVVCPPYLKFNWKAEIEKWTTRPRTITIYNHDELNAYGAPETDVLIIPDSVIGRADIFNHLFSASGTYTWLFIDECHRFKESSAKRTQALINAARTGFAHIVFLSGTPMVNRAMEVYPLISALAPEAINWRSEKEFGLIFGDPKVTPFYTRNGLVTRTVYGGISQPKRLKEELFRKLMIRHLKRNVLTELKPKIRQLIFTHSVKGELAKLEKRILRNISISDLLGDEFELGDIAEYRRLSGLAMIKPAVSLIEDFLRENPTKKLVVFAYHIEVIETLCKKLERYSPLKIRGGITDQIKKLSVDEFQNNPDRRLIIGNIDSMGVGLTLTAAQDGLMVESSWTPGINEQAEDRIHRISQTEQVTWRYLVSRNSISERMLYIALDKQEGIELVMS